MNDVGVVTIGRNEGERLRRCLASVAGRDVPVVYVDSASTDGSAEAARAMGVEVVALDLSRPFSAARARNEGFARLLQIEPHLRFVQFVDGDCQVIAGWMDHARREIDRLPAAAVVCGRRRERFPERSVYNRLADVEWNTPVGEAKSCGGDSMMRVDAFRAAGGFDASVAAGEEPELCQRLREAGHKIYRVDAEMTLHDSAMLHFGQWWKRAVRSGYGAMDVATRFGGQGLFVKQVKSAQFWTVGWLTLALSQAFIFGISTWVTLGMAGRRDNVRWALGVGFLAVLVQILILLMQAARLAIKVRRRVPHRRTAVAYGILTMIGKWANLHGQIQYLRDRAAGRNTRLIEYKTLPV